MLQTPLSKPAMLSIFSLVLGACLISFSHAQVKVAAKSTAPTGSLPMNTAPQQSINPPQQLPVNPSAAPKKPVDSKSFRAYSNGVIIEDFIIYKQ